MSLQKEIEEKKEFKKLKSLKIKVKSDDIGTTLCGFKTLEALEEGEEV